VVEPARAARSSARGTPRLPTPAAAKAEVFRNFRREAEETVDMMEAPAGQPGLSKRYNRRGPSLSSRARKSGGTTGITGITIGAERVAVKRIAGVRVAVVGIARRERIALLANRIRSRAAMELTNSLAEFGQFLAEQDGGQSRPGISKPRAPGEDARKDIAARGYTELSLPALAAKLLVIFPSAGR
jgi:hypothetical protein